MSILTLLYLLLLLGVGVGGYKIRRTSKLSLAGSLVAAFLAFAICFKFAVDVQSDFRGAALIIVACLIGILTAETELSTPQTRSQPPG